MIDPTDRRGFARFVETATDKELREAFDYCRTTYLEQPDDPTWRWALREVVTEAQVRKAVRQNKL